MTDTPPAHKPLTARIEVFRPGTFTPMGGKPITFSAAGLRAIADAYDPATAPAPIVVGHPGTDAPAFGWAESFDYDPAAGRLYANVGQIEPAAVAQIPGVAIQHPNQLVWTELGQICLVKLQPFVLLCPGNRRW